MVMDYKAGAGTEAQQYVWKGAIPLQIHLHDSEVTTLPPPTDALILAPRLGYLPLLVPKIKPFFSNSLPPGVDTVWFEYKGLPLKWHIPTGVLFDLLCAEPERPWKLTVHFRGYPGNILTPCEGEDNVKSSFKNALKEAAYIINGNCKNVMNLSQFDETELWHSVVNGLPEVYFPISSKLKLDITGEDFLLKLNSSASKSQESTDEPETSTSRTGRIPVRLYIRSINEDIDDLEDAPTVDSWEKISYINHPVEIQGEGKCYTLNDAVRELLPDLYKEESTTDANICGEQESEDGKGSEQTGEPLKRESGEIKLVRIQGIEPKMGIPFSWLVNNLMNPDHYLHICVYVKVLFS